MPDDSKKKEIDIRKKAVEEDALRAAEAMGEAMKMWSDDMMERQNVDVFMMTWGKKPPMPGDVSYGRPGNVLAKDDVPPAREMTLPMAGWIDGTARNPEPAIIKILPESEQGRTIEQIADSDSWSSYRHIAGGALANMLLTSLPQGIIETLLINLMSNNLSLYIGTPVGRMERMANYKYDRIRRLMGRYKDVTGHRIEITFHDPTWDRGMFLIDRHDDKEPKVFIFLDLNSAIDKLDGWIRDAIRLQRKDMCDE